MLYSASIPTPSHFRELILEIFLRGINEDKCNSERRLSSSRQCQLTDKCNSERRLESSRQCQLTDKCNSERRLESSRQCQLTDKPLGIYSLQALISCTVHCHMQLLFTRQKFTQIFWESPLSFPQGCCYEHAV